MLYEVITGSFVDARIHSMLSLPAALGARRELVDAVAAGDQAAQVRRLAAL